MLLNVMEQLLHIGRGELTSETRLHIFDLSRSEFILIVRGGVVKEWLVEDGLEELLEVAHETSIVAVLVLREDGEKAIVLLLLDGLAGLGL